MKTWGGRRAQRLTALMLQAKGTTCHLCDVDSVPATSADHEPPRSVLLRLGVADPDALAYLFPAHLPCNVERNDRPITPELRETLTARRLAELAPVARSPRWSTPLFESRPSGWTDTFPSLPGTSEKTQVNGGVRP